MRGMYYGHQIMQTESNKRKAYDKDYTEVMDT